MDTGFTNQRDSDAMNEYNRYRAEDYLKEKLDKVRQDRDILGINLSIATSYLNDVLNGCYCVDDIKRFIQNTNNPNN